MIDAKNKEDEDEQYLNYMYEIEKEQQRQYKSYEEFIEIEFPNYDE